MATSIPSSRACNWCPNPGADCCIRVHPSPEGGHHVYAHRICAAVRGVGWLYRILTPGPAR
ncbi:hypothetical protein [Streptomyces sp. S1]|uniref:hypothetical protein n=1 Tax=Streptomyces sp. S1 TaxID=718288 RepID=UPI003D70F01E